MSYTATGVSTPLSVPPKLHGQRARTRAVMKPPSLYTSHVTLIHQLVRGWGVEGMRVTGNTPHPTHTHYHTTSLTFKQWSVVIWPPNPTRPLSYKHIGLSHLNDSGGKTWSGFCARGKWSVLTRSA